MSTATKPNKAKKEIKAKLPKEITNAFFSIVPAKERKAFEKVTEYGRTLSKELNKLDEEKRNIHHEMEKLYRKLTEDIKQDFGHPYLRDDIEKSILTVSYDEKVTGNLSDAIAVLAKEWDSLNKKPKKNANERKRMSDIRLALKREIENSGVQNPRYLQWKEDCTFNYELQQQKQIDLSKNKEFMALRKKRTEIGKKILQIQDLLAVFEKEMHTTHCIAGSRMSPFMMMHPAMMFGGFR